MSFLDRIRECNNWNPRHFRRFKVAGQAIGWVKPAFAAALAPYRDVFRVGEAGVELNPALDDPESRTAAVDEVLRTLADAERDGGPLIRGWRDEAYPVASRWRAPPLMLMERAAIPYFGIRAYGIHMNGYVRDGGRLAMWVARRARDKPTYPGMLDNMVAGGQPVGISLADNLVKECAEEASIPAPLARQAVPTGAITYRHEMADGLKPDVQFIYDLELPADFTPRNDDGEVEEFYLWPIEKVVATVRDTRAFKFNCNLAIIHFLVVHGLIPPDDPDYVDIVEGLHG